MSGSGGGSGWAGDGASTYTPVNRAARLPFSVCL